jgi:hypothetical protein
VRAKFADVIRWRWMPFFALVAASLFYVALVVALVPAEMESGDTPERRSIPISPPDVMNSGAQDPAMGSRPFDSPEPQMPEQPPPPPPSMPPQDFAPRGFSPPLERAVPEQIEPPPPAPPPPPEAVVPPQPVPTSGTEHVDEEQNAANVASAAEAAQAVVNSGTRRMHRGPLGLIRQPPPPPQDPAQNQPAPAPQADGTK